MNTTLYLMIGLVSIIVLAFLFINCLKSVNEPDEQCTDRLFWSVDCTVFNGYSWIDKQLTLTVSLDEQDQTHLMAQAVVERYMESMNYPKGEYTIGYINRLTEQEYNLIRKDMFVTLHGYSYE